MEEGTGSDGGIDARHQQIDVGQLQKCIATFSRMEEASSSSAVAVQTSSAGGLLPQDGEPSSPNWSMLQCDVSHSRNSEWFQKMLQRARATDLGAQQNELFMRVTGATAANFHEHPRVKEMGLLWSKTWQDTGEHVGTVDSTQVMCSSLTTVPMMCSNFEDVPEIVKQWLTCLWEQQIPQKWRLKQVASISIVELRKGQFLGSSAFVIVTHGYLSWKDTRLGKNGEPFLMCRLTEIPGVAGVLFFIFQKEFIQMIDNAPMQSMIGLCGLETVPKNGHLNHA